MLRRMADGLTRSALRKLENVEAFPLIALQALREVRSELDDLEAKAILRARELGASLEDIADAMGITRQGVSYRLKQLAGDTNGEDEDVVDLSAEEAEGTRRRR
jgi:DNA-directed RNA polymerase specialized sigma24 family protein